MLSVSRGLSAAAALFLSGCGYVGDPLPPALKIPIATSDLRGVQIGDRLVFDFTIPALSTDDVPIQRLSAVELRLGKTSVPFDLESWAASAKQIPADSKVPGPVKIEVPAAEWMNEEAVGGVRVAGPSGRWSGWSNLAVLKVIRSLDVPESLVAQSDPTGVRLSWNVEERAGIGYNVFRKAPDEVDFALLSKTERAEFVDSTAVLGTKYSYSVEAILGSAKSERSPPVSISSKDIFGPATPSGVIAISALGSIELSWEQNPEPDLQGYRVYRGEPGNLLQLIGKELVSPAFSDKKLVSGKTYRYAVTAVDAVGNESGQSEPVEIVAP